MSPRRALACAAAAALLTGAIENARAACPPPDALLEVVRASTRVQLEQLGSDDTRIETPFAHVPGRTLGYEVQGLFRVTGAVANALRDALGRRDSYACVPDAPAARFETPDGLPIGLLFAGNRGAVAVVLHLPEGAVELQLEGSAHTTAPMSKAGQRRWELALALLSRETRTSPSEFYEQMLPPGRAPAAPAPAADTASAPRDEPRPPR